MQAQSSLRNKVPLIGRVTAMAALMLLVVCTTTSTQAQSWVSTATQAYPTQYLTNATMIGSLSPSTTMHIVVGLQEQNVNLVQATLRQMVTAGGPLYGKSLSVDQFAQQFGATTAQVNAVQDYLASNGFTNISVSENNLLLEADGTAANSEAAFNTTLAEYSVSGKTVYLNTAAAQVPDSLAGTVIAVLGLNNIVAVHSDLRNLGPGSSPQTDPCSPPNCPIPDPDNESYGAQQYQIAYNAALPNGTQEVATGKSTAIGIIAEGDLTQVVKDLRTYETTYKLPQVPVTVVNAGMASPDTSGADEWDLDSQTSTGIAQQVSHLYFYAATSLTDSDLGLAINKAVTSNKVKAFNMSLGECEYSAYIDGSMQLDDQIFGEAALQGITPFASSDDNGSSCPVASTNGVPMSGPPMTSYFASSPYVVAVGGTYLLTNSDFTYNTETAADFSGGGISLFETSPFWQGYTGSGTLPIVPSDEIGDRGVPDVSMCAGGAEVAICAANIFVDGTATLVGGTSLSSPLAMGAWARIETSHKNALGFASPLIYQLANGGPTASSTYFNDVIVGGNGLYTALPGYDYVTGLGSWDILTINKVIPSTYPQ